MLLMGSDNSGVTGTCQPANAADQASLATARTLLAASTGPVWCCQIDGAQHFDFSDYGAYYLAAPLHGLAALGDIDGDLSLDFANAYLTAFVDHVMTGRLEPLLTARSSRYPQVRVNHLLRG